MKLDVIWDLDGTLINSEHEIINTVRMSLDSIGVSLGQASSPLIVGPPLPDMLRQSFCRSVLSDKQIENVCRRFRTIYDASRYDDTFPYEGIDDIICSSNFISHVITNKPDYASRRIILMKGWSMYVTDILCPDTLMEEKGRHMKKIELFEHFIMKNKNNHVVSVGDMPSDVICAKTFGIPSIGVLWGSGKQEELEQSGCDIIVKSAKELSDALIDFCGYDE